jgi:GNAT superfamily N-acetyltransferase
MSDLHVVEADEALRERLGREWGPVVAAHMHLGDGFTLVALDGNTPAGLLSIAWRELPPPLPPTAEAFIDIIEVAAAYRRRGVARRLVALAAERARSRGAYQLRAWSSADKDAAIPMWRALGFGLCPATTYPRDEPIEGYFVARVLV